MSSVSAARLYEFVIDLGVLAVGLKVMFNNRACARGVIEAVRLMNGIDISRQVFLHRIIAVVAGLLAVLITIGRLIRLFQSCY